MFKGIKNLFNFINCKLSMLIDIHINEVIYLFIDVLLNMCPL